MTDFLRKEQEVCLNCKKCKKSKGVNKMKKFLALLLVAIMIFSLVACGKAEETPAPAAEEAEEVSSEPCEITVWTFLNPADETGRGKVLADAKALYEKNNPNVTVNIESLQWDTLTAKFFAAAQTGEAPDVVWVNGLDLGQAIALGVVEPFENLFLKDWTPEQIADIDDARFQYGTAVDGNHYQIHLSTNVWGITYRADLFEKFGIDPDFESWDELIEAAQTLTFHDDESGIDVYGLGTAYSEENADTCLLEVALLTQYGDFVDENGQANWVGEVGKDALQMQFDMIDKYGVTPPSAISSTYEELVLDFCAGKYAMMLSGTVRIPTMKSQCVFNPDDIKFMPFPDMDGNPGRGLAAGWNICVWSGSEHKQEAGKFVETLCCPEIDYEWVTEAGQIPFLKSTVESASEYLSNPNNEFLVTALDLLENNAATYNSEYLISGYRKDLVRSMQLAYVDGMTIEEALQSTADEFNERNGN